MALKDLSETAASNTSIDGTNVGEGTAMSNLNNGIRAVAAILRQGLAGDADTVPSSPTCNIPSVLSNYVSISGSSTINGFSAGSPGLWKFLQFQSILSLTHSASLLCPGNASITTAADDIAVVRYDSSTVSRIISYTRAAVAPSAYAPSDARYLTTLINADLTNERVLAFGPGMTVADGGAGSQYTATIGLGSGLSIASNNIAYTGPFTKSYDSGNISITSAGAAASPYAHGLGAVPKVIQTFLKCTSAEHNYSVNDETPAHLTPSTNQGVSIVADATNINIRFGSAAGAFGVLNKTTGAAANITNSSWALIIRAYA